MQYKNNDFCFFIRYNKQEVKNVKQYLDMCRYILEHGEDRDDRTGTGHVSVFGYQTRYDLREGFLDDNKKDVFKTYCRRAFMVY